MLFTNMLHNVGLRLQTCRTPTKGVNDAVSPLFTFTAETTRSGIHAFKQKYNLLRKSIFHQLIEKAVSPNCVIGLLKVDKAGVYLFIIFRIKINQRLQNKNVVRPRRVRRPITFSEANLVVVYYIVFVQIFCKMVINNQGKELPRQLHTVIPRQLLGSPMSPALKTGEI